MATTLRDFIALREAEIKEQQKALKAEMRELQVAKNALDAQEPPTAVAQSSGPTIKDMARFVLNHAVAKDGLTSAEILAYIKEEYGRDIDRTSLSPQLSRLKDSGDLVLEGERWFTKSTWDAKQHSADEWQVELGANIPDRPFATIEEDEDDVPF